MRKGGDLFVFGMIGGAVFAGIYRLVTGHWPEHLDYAMWGLIAGSILTDAESYLTETLETSKELKRQLEDLSCKVDSLQQTVKCNFEGKTESAVPPRRVHPPAGLEAGLRRLDSIQREIRTKKAE